MAFAAMSQEKFLQAKTRLSQHPVSFYAIMCPYELTLAGHEDAIVLYGDKRVLLAAWTYHTQYGVCLKPSRIQIIYGPLGQPWVKQAHYDMVMHVCCRLIHGDSMAACLPAPRWCGSGGMAVFHPPIMSESCTAIDLVPQAFIPHEGIPPIPWTLAQT